MEKKYSFQAKDIQKILGIARQRYEYLATKIGIRPEIEEGSGRGKINRYSFKNLFEFALVNRGSYLGSNPMMLRNMLIFLQGVDKLGRIYDADHKIPMMTLYYLDYGNIGENVIRQTCELYGGDDYWKFYAYGTKEDQNKFMQIERRMKANRRKMYRLNESEKKVEKPTPKMMNERKKLRLEYMELWDKQKALVEDRKKILQASEAESLQVNEYHLNQDIFATPIDSIYDVEGFMAINISKMRENILRVSRA